jgi:hypothetical protein
VESIFSWQVRCRGAPPRLVHGGGPTRTPRPPRRLCRAGGTLDTDAPVVPAHRCAAAGPHLRGAFRRGCRGATADHDQLTTTNFTQVGNYPTGVGVSVPGYIAPAFLSNGFLGVRAGPIPLLAGAFAGTTRPRGPFPGGVPTVPAVVAGYMHRDPKGRERVLAAAPFPFETYTLVTSPLGGGAVTSLQRSPELVSVLRQSLDMRDGTLRTSLVFADRHSSPPSRRFSLQLDVVQFTSRSDPTLASTRITALAKPANLNVTIQPAISLPARCRQRARCAGYLRSENSENSETPVPNCTWDPCTTISLVSDCGSTLGLTAKGQQRAGARAGELTYELVASAVAGEVLGDGADEAGRGDRDRRERRRAARAAREGAEGGGDRGRLRRHRLRAVRRGRRVPGAANVRPRRGGRR